MADERTNVMNAFLTRANTVFGKKDGEITDDTTFEELHAKSVQISQITTYLEDEFDIEIPYMKFRRKKTVGEAVDYVVELLDA